MDSFEWNIWFRNSESVSVGRFIGLAMEKYEFSQVHDQIEAMLVEFLNEHVNVSEGSWSDLEKVYGMIGGSESRIARPQLAQVYPRDILRALHHLNGMLPADDPMMEALPSAAPSVSSQKKLADDAKKEEQKVRQNMALDRYDAEEPNKRGTAIKVVNDRDPGLRKRDPDQFKKEVEKIRAHLNRNF